MVGQRPPPCGGTTFNMIDSHRALLFGGRQETGRVSHIYIFDFETMVSSLIYMGLVLQVGLYFTHVSH